MTNGYVNDKEKLFLEKCRKNKLRITPQRRAVFRALVESESHPSADAIFKVVRRKLPNVSFDTVNRTLLTFAEIGIVGVVEGQGGPRRFDPNIRSHHHLHCLRCGRIIDFCNDEYDQLQIPAQIKRQFTVLNKKVVITGICKLCEQKE